MAELIAYRPELLDGASGAQLVLVIFTTAQIWTSEVDLGAAELKTGEFKLEQVDATQRDWIWYQYPVSPGIKHVLHSDDTGSELGDVLIKDYVRTIAIVSVSGIDSFLPNGIWS